MLDGPALVAVGESMASMKLTSVHPTPATDSKALRFSDSSSSVTSNHLPSNHRAIGAVRVEPTTGSQTWWTGSFAGSTVQTA
jgi:hypothetical protein